ncbi:alkyl sulfatase dimerization domain-containing protein [Streptomyces sp. NPDC057621]|uniref:alkyl sulfatase dimerization domain-containing protein n=1 Tax=Streptomyces sp. NPDC057621 TaxID=3346186 RepID=UPI0036C1E7C1
MPDEGDAHEPVVCAEIPRARTGRPTVGPPRRAADIGRHTVDAIAAPAAFLATESHWGPEQGAVFAVLVAVAVAVLRRHRGDSLFVVTVSTSIVAFHSASAIAFGEGRAFYFPELVINAAAFIVCAGSLAIGRPVTEAVCRRAGVEPDRTAGDPAARRRHRRLTAGWTALWVSHLVPLCYLYAVDSVVGLTLLSALFAKPTLLLMAGFTVLAVRRGTPPGRPRQPAGARAHRGALPCPRNPPQRGPGMNRPSILRQAADMWTGRRAPTSMVEPTLTHAEEVADGVLMVPGFGHAFAIRHADGVVLFDTGAALFADRLHDQVTAWDSRPLTHAVYSHGHVDHVGGLGRFDADADVQDRPRPVVIAHENVLTRFRRYATTQGYNTVINRRQFRMPDLVWPTEFRHPDVTVTDTHVIEVGGLRLELTHHRGETDDHLVGFLPEQRILFPGDLFLGVAPNAGNPQKVQRHPVEWAAALRRMASLDARLMLGSHGIPVVGSGPVREALENTARYLETLVEQTIAHLNDGATLTETVHRVRVPDDLAELHYLQPLYDEPEFVVRNVWRQFAGWYDGNPAHLKPATDEQLAAELAMLSGGAQVLADRALDLARAGSHRLACHLAQLAGDAAPADTAVHTVRAEVYSLRAAQEHSTMSTGIFTWAEAESRGVIAGTDAMTELAPAAPAR